MISATRYAVDIHVPSVPLAPILPAIVGSEEFTIEMSRVAIKAPIVPAATANQADASASSSSVRLNPSIVAKIHQIIGITHFRYLLVGSVSMNFTVTSLGAISSSDRYRSAAKHRYRHLHQHE